MGIAEESSEADDESESEEEIIVKKLRNGKQREEKFQGHYDSEDNKKQFSMIKPEEVKSEESNEESKEERITSDATDDSGSEVSSLESEEKEVPEANNIRKKRRGRPKIVPESFSKTWGIAKG